MVPLAMVSVVGSHFKRARTAGQHVYSWAEVADVNRAPSDVALDLGRLLAPAAVGYMKLRAIARAYAWRKLRGMIVRPGTPIVEYWTGALKAVSDALSLVENQESNEAFACAMREVAKFMHTLILAGGGELAEEINNILGGFSDAGVDLSDWAR